MNVDTKLTLADVTEMVVTGTVLVVEGAILEVRTAELDVAIVVPAPAAPAAALVTDGVDITFYEQSVT